MVQNFDSTINVYNSVYNGSILTYIEQKHEEWKAYSPRVYENCFENCLKDLENFPVKANINDGAEEIENGICYHVLSIYRKFFKFN